MAEIRLFKKFKDNNDSILTGFTGNEVKEFMRDLQKEIDSLGRQIKYRSNRDLDHEIKERKERRGQLMESLKITQSQVKDWFKPGKAAGQESG